MFGAMKLTIKTSPVPEGAAFAGDHIRAQLIVGERKLSYGVYLLTESPDWVKRIDIVHFLRQLANAIEDDGKRDHIHG